MEVLPASARIVGVVLRAALRDLIKCREAGLGPFRGGEEGHPQAVPVGPVAVWVGDDLTKSRKIEVIEFGVVLRSAPPPAACALNRNQRLEQLDDFGRLNLNVRPEIDDPGEPWLPLPMPAARPSQWMRRRDGGRIGPHKCAGRRARSLEESMLGAGTARLFAAPMQMKLILDFAALRVSPVTARRDHHGRRPEHELQVPPRDRRRLVGLDGQNQAVAQIALAGTASDESRNRRRENRRSRGIRSLCRLVCCVLDDGVEARPVERHPHRTQHLIRAFGEGAQDRIRTVIGIFERRIDEARELRPIGLQTDLCRHGRSLANSGRALAPFME
jgi:hypothetical protein